MAIRQTVAGTWEVDHYFFDSNGKRRRKLRTFAKYKDAVAYEKEALAQVQKREFIAPSKVTVGEKATDWLEKRFANGNYERATRIERENYVHHYIIPAFGSLLIQNLAVERIEKQATEWNKKVSAMVVNRVLRTLTDIMAEAKRHGVIKDNPAAEAERLKEETEVVTPDKVLTKAELRQVINATESGTMEKVIVMLPALTGCRVGELLAARWGALDLDKGKFDICSTMADPERGEEVIFKKPKTAQSLRTVPLSKELVHELRLWKFKSPSSTEPDLVIISDRGKPVRRRAVHRLIQRIIDELEIKKHMTPHSLRHTFASLLLADKVSVPEVSHLLGHKNSAITMKTYAHFTGEETNSVHNFSASLFENISNNNVSTDVSITSSNAK
jgi:integrase